MDDILLVLGGGIGNLIQATPAIQVLASKFNVDLRIHCNSSNDVQEILKIPAIRKIYSRKDPEIEYLYQFNGPFTPGKQHKATKYLRSRINYAQHIPEAEVYCDFAKQVGVTARMPDTIINIGKDGPVPKSSKSIVIYPGSKHNWAMKRWDKFDKLAAKLKNVIVVGTHNDIHSHGNPAWITTPWKWPKNVEFFSGSLREVAHLISKCRAFIGNDGGLAHVAAATGIPTFVLFGPSSYIKNKPFSSKAHVIAIDLPCRPCQFAKDIDGLQIFKENKADCPYHMKCMKSMSVDYVMAAFNKRMK